MKRKILIIIVSLVVLFINTNVFATCYDDALNNWAEKLEIKFQEVKNGEYPYSYLLMLNTPRNDLRVVANDTYSNGPYNVTYDSEFKNYVIGSEVHTIDKKYILTIYMSDSAKECSGEKMKTIEYTVPQYNSYNDTEFCEDNPDDKICGSYTEVEKTDKIDKIIEDHSNDKIEEELYLNAPFFEKVWMIIKEYSLYVLIPLVSLALIYKIIIFIIKKRSEKK